MVFDHELALDALLKIGAAAILGGLVGYERDRHGRAAGLRTHLLVCMGSAVFMILSLEVARRVGEAGTVADPGRIAAQIVTGIGFLGAGVILKTGTNVHGLTTAACLWVVAAIGMAVGGGWYGIAIIATVVALVALVVLKRLEWRFTRDSYRVLTVTTGIDVTASEIIAMVKRPRLRVLRCDIERDYAERTTITRLSICLADRGVTDKLAHGIISSLEASPVEIRSVSWSQE
jgi:putative Mg2+ transporter-C (MgtC) family protein